MERRRFLQGMAATLALSRLPLDAQPSENIAASPPPAPGSVPAEEISIAGHTLLCTFRRGPETWKAYEDLRTRDGVMTLLSSTGKARVLPKTAEAVFAEEGPAYLGLDLKTICTTPRDLLADK